jgi:hypothetical protein
LTKIAHWLRLAQKRFQNVQDHGVTPASRTRREACDEGNRRGRFPGSPVGDENRRANFAIPDDIFARIADVVQSQDRQDPSL